MSKNSTTVRGNKFLLWCASIQERHWGYYLFLVNLSAIWFSLIIAYFGEFLHLTRINENGKTSLTIGGGLCTGVLLFIIILGAYSKRYAESLRDVPFEDGGFRFLNGMRDTIKSGCETKVSTLLSYIASVKQSASVIAPSIVSEPGKQLQILATEMSSCLRPLLQEDGHRWKSDDLYVSIAYQFPCENDEWHWATPERGLSLQELLSSEDSSVMSTFQYVLSSKGRLAFFNSKAKAEKDKHYIEDDLDERDGETGELLGSIACYKDILKHEDKTYIKYILTVSTYSRRFVVDNNPNVIENVRHNIKEFVLPDFTIRIQKELCFLYLSYLNHISNKKEDG